MANFIETKKFLKQHTKLEVLPFLSERNLFLFETKNNVEYLTYNEYLALIIIDDMYQYDENGYFYLCSDFKRIRYPYIDCDNNDIIAFKIECINKYLTGLENDNICLSMNNTNNKHLIKTINQLK